MAALLLVRLGSFFVDLAVTVLYGFRRLVFLRSLSKLNCVVTGQFDQPFVLFILVLLVAIYLALDAGYVVSEAALHDLLLSLGFLLFLASR